MLENIKRNYTSVNQESEVKYSSAVIIERLKKAENYLNLYDAVALNKGILAWSEIADLPPISDEITYFIPASGAASRLFAFLYEKNHPDIEIFFTHLEKFAFFNLLKQSAKNLDINFQKMCQEQDVTTLLTLLSHEPSSFLSQLKGMVPFHYQTNRHQIETAFDAQIEEILLLDQTINLHFSLSQQKLVEVMHFFQQKKIELQKKSDKKIKISWSVQDPATEVPMLDLQTHLPVSTTEGALALRPAGHGALLENLNQIDTNFIYIKNIDNVVAEPFRKQMTVVKNALLSKLKAIVQQTHIFLRKLEHYFSEELKSDLQFFLQPFVHPDFIFPENKEFYINFLNRPIRVCGMVLAKGQKGGGPFWVKNSQNWIQLQIVETPQIELKNPQQKQLLEASTYFNPVHVAGYIKDFKGKKFYLPDYVDSDTFFISEKSVKNQKIRIYEQPGLWNGSMSNWLTLFVEVPEESFNAVKKINDLLNTRHQI